MSNKQLTTDELIKKLQKNIAAKQAKITPAERKAEAKKAAREFKRKYRDDFRDIDWKLDLKGHFVSKKNLDIPRGKAAYDEAIEELRSHIAFASSMREGSYSSPIKGKPTSCSSTAAVSGEAATSAVRNRSSSSTRRRRKPSFSRGAGIPTASRSSRSRSTSRPAS